MICPLNLVHQKKISIIILILLVLLLCCPLSKKKRQNLSPKIWDSWVVTWTTLYKLRSLLSIGLRCLSKKMNIWKKEWKWISTWSKFSNRRPIADLVQARIYIIEMKWCQKFPQKVASTLIVSLILNNLAIEEYWLL